MSEPLALAPDALRVLLCDADDCLFPSERPAFEASTRVVNALLADLGVETRFTPEALRARAVGRNFRATAVDLAAEHGVELDAADLERRVERERREVTAYLARTLSPDETVRAPLAALAERYALAVVSSSALARLDACFAATGLAGLLPAAARFSAEDSLPVPASKPDPAVYELAGRELGVAGAEALAIEDSPTGVMAAVGAGFPAVGMTTFVASGERERRVAALRAAGALAVVSSWAELAALLGVSAPAGARLSAMP